MFSDREWNLGRYVLQIIEKFWRLIKKPAAYKQHKIILPSFTTRATAYVCNLEWFFSKSIHSNPENHEEDSSINSFFNTYTVER